MILNACGVTCGFTLLCLLVVQPACAHQEGLERLSSIRVYKVQDEPAPKAQQLAPPSSFFETDQPSRWHGQTAPGRLSTDVRRSNIGLGQAASGRAQQRRVQWQARSLDRSAYTDWELGARNWRYQGDDGFRLTLGGDRGASPTWARDVRLSGVSVYQTYGADKSTPWSYAMSVGALDLTPDIDQGDLVYGPTAASVTFSVSPLKNLALDSQLESTSGLSVLGLGGTYQTGPWGVWQASVARASHALGDGWRYQASYGLDVLEDVHVQWQAEQYKSRFADLSRYQSLASQRGGSRQAWELSAPVRHVGEVGTHYVVTRNDLGLQDRYVGLSQQFWYSSSLRVRLQARRHLDGQNSSIALRFSLPIF